MNATANSDGTINYVKFASAIQRNAVYNKQYQDMRIAMYRNLANGMLAPEAGREARKAVFGSAYGTPNASAAPAGSENAPSFSAAELSNAISEGQLNVGDYYVLKKQDGTTQLSQLSQATYDSLKQ